MKFKIFIAITIICFFAFACSYSKKISNGNEIAQKVEKFRSEKGRLPNSLVEIGIVENESGPIYYKKESESKYILWFGSELGESVTYDSETKKWK